MDGATLLPVLRELGFPIFVAVWFMWRFEKKLDRYTDLLSKLIIITTVIAKTLAIRDADDLLKDE